MLSPAIEKTWSVAATNEALRAGDRMLQAKLGRLTGGLGLPGL